MEEFILDENCTSECDEPPSEVGEDSEDSTLCALQVGGLESSSSAYLMTFQEHY